MTEEAKTVEAEVLDAGAAIEVAYTPAIIDAASYLADRGAKVRAYMEPYEGMTEDGLRDLDKREVYNLRADVNKVIKAMKSEVSAIRKAHMAPFDAFKEQADGVIAQAEGAHALLDKVFKEKERFDKDDRRAQLEEEYLGCAGILAEVIPFDAILDDKWLTDTAWKGGKALGELADKTVAALDGYNTLQARELTHKDEVVRRYCETLDVMAALKLEDELLAKDRELEEFKARQAELERERAERAAAYEAEMREQRAETEAEAFAEAPVAPAAAEAEPEPAEAPERAAAETTAPCPQVFAWSLAMEFTGTESRAKAVASLLQSNGLTGATIKCKGVVNG